MTHLFVTLVVRHREAVLDGDDVPTDRSQERANDAFLSFVPSDVRIAHVEEHERWDLRDHVVHISGKGQSVGHLNGAMDEASTERVQGSALRRTSSRTGRLLGCHSYGGALNPPPEDKPDLTVHERSSVTCSFDGSTVLGGSRERDRHLRNVSMRVRVRGIDRFPFRDDPGGSEPWDGDDDCGLPMLRNTGRLRDRVG